ncbi:MAG: hypothetical protein MJZ26_10965 [Fibrobacter sp.]|nr:hypothetical protein [Fibrobacter sp.]
MNIEIAAICDAATANGMGGRLNILGAFDRIFAQQFPLVIPQCSAAFRIRYQRSEVGVHELSLVFEDVVGEAVVPPMQSKIPLEPVAQGFDTAAVNLVLNLQRLPIKRADKYIIRLNVDGEELISLPLYVVTAPQQNRPVAQGEQKIENNDVDGNA